MNDAWQIVRLGSEHDRREFDCGQTSLDEFLRRHAGQNARKDILRTYVLTQENSTTVAGYYSLSTGSTAFETLPDDLARRLPRYPIPTAHLGRLAVDRRWQGRGLGGILLVDALMRVRDIADQIGIHAVTVHSLNDRARTFYEAHGFISLHDDPHHLFLPMATVRML